MAPFLLTAECEGSSFLPYTLPPFRILNSFLPSLLHLLSQHGEERRSVYSCKTLFLYCLAQPWPSGEHLLCNTYGLGNESAQRHCSEPVSSLNWATVPSLLGLLASVSPHVKWDVLIKWVSICKHLSGVTSEIYIISEESLWVTYYKDVHPLTDVKLTC